MRYELLKKSTARSSITKIAQPPHHARGRFVNGMRSVVLGCGSYLPQRVLTNEELARTVDTSDEWITQRTGIRERHIAAPGEFTSHLGVHAARAALADAGVDAQDIDLIVVATSTPDNTFPATAVSVRPNLASTTARPSTCGGVLGIRLRDGGGGRMLKSGWLQAGARSERRRSRASRLNDRGTCVLFATVPARWCWRRSGRKSQRARHFGNAAPFRRPLQGKALVDGGPSRPGLWDTCAWKAARSSATPLPTSLRWSCRRWRRAFTRQGNRLVCPHQANKRITMARAEARHQPR